MKVSTTTYRIRRSGSVLLAALVVAIAAGTSYTCSRAQSASYAQPPGVVVAHSPAATRAYLGSPAIAILPDGTYVIAHDSFGEGSPQNKEDVYASKDGGRSWHKVAHLDGQFWSSLFVYDGALYIFGTTGYGGVPAIRKSVDGGVTWTVPRDAQSGLFAFKGQYFTAAVPVVVANGRVWRTMEEIGKNGVLPFMMSAPVGSNLLDASNWTSSNRLSPDSTWLDGKFHGWLEGNAVVAPDGGVVNVLRVYYNALPEKAALVTVNRDGARAQFDPSNGFVDMPGAGKKFTIRFDPKTHEYWTLTNAVLPDYRDSNYERARNTLALASSSDLVHWEVRRTVLHDSDSRRHGFQYADWQFDGDDIVAAVRTSFDDADGGAHSQHDSNYITFSRVKNFRSEQMDVGSSR